MYLTPTHYFSCQYVYIDKKYNQQYGSVLNLVIIVKEWKDKIKNTFTSLIIILKKTECNI
jgi:hypothetical protein